MRVVDFQFPPKVQQLQARITTFMETHIYPNEARFKAEIAEGDRWQPTAIVEELKQQAEAWVRPNQGPQPGAARAA